MHEESPKRILLVGATGYAGRKLANYLLTSTDVTIILSGRDRSKLGDLRSSLPTLDLSRRTELLELDAANTDVAALPDFVFFGRVLVDTCPRKHSRIVGIE